MSLPPPEQVWLHSNRGDRFAASYRFEEPAGSILAHRPDDLCPALDDVENAVREGLHAVGLVTYEAAGAFDRALTSHEPDPILPRAWFGLYRRRCNAGASDLPTSTCTVGPWRPAVSRAEHAARVGAIRDYVEAGDTYQVNLTFPMRATFSGDPAALYQRLRRSQHGAGFCAYLDLGAAAVLSTSPELFFSLSADGRLETRPMKGTRHRGRWVEEDDELARELSASGKDRAENVMIVDLLRNDLGRVAQPGSVAVPALWQVEALDTVWQMTSTVTGRPRSECGLADLFAALFPCGSVTGAPKIRAAQIIRELEAEPRGAYTGSIGYLSPASRPGSGRLSGIEARFSVAIRTVTIDRAAGLARAGVGGGITWESEADAEYEECMAKARYLTEDRPAFELLETLLFEPGRGYYLLGRHLHRLAASARYFGFAFDEGRVRASLEAVAAGASRVLRVRLCLDRDGTPSLASTQLQAGSDEVTAVVAKGVIVDDRDRFLYHKTTHRGLYERALAEARVRGADEAILINARGQVTETTAGNLVVQTGSGRLITPPVSCGLLAGTLRDELLAAGRIEEGVVHTADLRSPSIVAYRINSVRRWVRLDIDPGADRVGGDATAAHSDRQL